VAGCAGGGVMPRKLAGPCHVKACPNLSDCAEHKRTTSGRDYGSSHQAERRMWQQRIDQGAVKCRRCNKPIPPHDPTAWDLGHPAPKAPECRGCNRSTMGRDRT
jgi:hypothetical protein